MLGAIYVQAYGFDLPSIRGTGAIMSPRHTALPGNGVVQTGIKGTGSVGSPRRTSIQDAGFDLTRNRGTGEISSRRSQISLCGLGRRITCIVDGDTGWEGGRKWRLLSVDTPELSRPGCRAEYDKAAQARDRLVALMRDGYRIVWSGRQGRYGRALVDIQLSNGQSAGQVLLDEGLAQGWPNTGNVWCGR
jgi:endonuclease YncB( thermonuclease family)